MNFLTSLSYIHISKGKDTHYFIYSITREVTKTVFFAKKVLNTPFLPSFLTFFCVCLVV